MNHSVLYSSIHRYLELKQALGRGYAIERHVLFALDRFLADTPAADLTAETFAGWWRRDDGFVITLAAPPPRRVPERLAP